MKKETEEHACPALSGTCIGWEPEYLGSDKKWHHIKVQTVPNGFGVKDTERGELMLAHMMEYNAAMAHAWTFKANSGWRDVPVRVVPYRVVFDMKAYRQEKKAKKLK